MITDVFTTVTARIELPFLTSVDGLIAAFVAWLAGPMAAALVLYVALMGVLFLRGASQEPFGEVMSRVLRLCIIVWLCTNAAVYNLWVRDFFLTALPTELNNAASGAGVGVPLSAAAFDRLWQRSIGVGMSVWSTLGWSDIGPSLAVLFMWVCAGLAIAFSYLVWLMARIGLGLVVAVGPLFIALGLFPATRALMERWVGQLLSFVLLQLLVVVLLRVLVDSQSELIDRIATGSASASGAQRLQMLLAVSVLFVVCAAVAMQLPSLASALAGGVAFHTGTLARATFGNAIQAGARLDRWRTQTTRAAVVGGARLGAAAFGRARDNLRRSGGAISGPLSGGSHSGVSPPRLPPRSVP